MRAFVASLLLTLLVFGAGYLAGLPTAATRPVEERVAATEYAVGVSRLDYVRLDRRLLALEAKEPFRDFQTLQLAAAVNQVGQMANGLLEAVRELYSRMGRPSPV